ncbi:MAG: multicopper oxidase family protein [Acidobacteria bacterium]|nr:multicopper oxidase family protein [Acidobacteriota bacterium]MBV9148085.1 multicopper oxidase family protein [Acidobacteriota bacterium]MBV9435270.1 multicopper oxidase family protein [Acidobacteriota bacterium]
MGNRKVRTPLSILLPICLATFAAHAQSFRVQCPTSTITHPSTVTNVNAEPAYNGPTVFATVPVANGQGGYLTPTSNVNGAIKCQQISGGDGYSTMADGTQTFMFSFGPLSGLADIANGLPGTQFPTAFNSLYPYPTPLQPGDPATTDKASDSPYTQGGYQEGAPGAFAWNGAVGLVPDVDANNGSGTAGALIDGHVDPRQIMDVGVMNGNIPAPLIGIDEDDELFLTLTNVGMIMRPDLFEQHTVHFHGYPNASSFYDGVPDASVAINIGGSFTYYYLSPDAGTYFYHCHITPPEHLQMGMVGQLYVRPRQNRLASGTSLYAGLQFQQSDLRTACSPANDILCSATLPAINTGTAQGPDKLGNPQKYAYNDGDGSTAYDVEYPLQMHGFDPNFHFVGMTFNPEAFVDMKDKYFLLNGRSYPDTVRPGPQATQSSDGKMHYSQPLPAIINIPVGGKALLRLVNLSVSEYHTIQSLGVPMKVVGWNAKLLRDQEGNNTEYYTNSITLGGGESLDAILDASNTALFQPGQVFYLYSPNLDHLSNDAENFGGLMTEVHICNSVSSSTFGNTCN